MSPNFLFLRRARVAVFICPVVFPCLCSRLRFICCAHPTRLAFSSLGHYMLRGASFAFCGEGGRSTATLRERGFAYRGVG